MKGSGKMKEISNVRGTQKDILELEVTEYIVYVRKNIHKINVLIMDETITMWEYDEIQYTKNEYIEYLSRQIDLMQKAINNLILK